MSVLSQLGESASSIQKEIVSWLSPSKVEVSDVPAVGSKAPSSSKLQVPSSDGKPTIITFLRHCGCPFAEKTFINFRELASSNPEVNFVAVSHSDQASTDKWATAVGGTGKVKLIVDFEREVYAQWGLGITSFWHVLSPTSLGAVSKLSKEEGINNRWTESGNRWQSSGSFAADDQGVVKWSKPAASANDIPDFEEALHAVA